MRVVLIQPRSSWGQHIYLPNGLLMMAARLMSIGVQVDIVDENVDGHLFTPRTRRLLRQADAIGVGVLGAPYIPEAIYVAKTIRRWGPDQPIYIGGPVIGNLTEDEFKMIFREVDGQLVYDPHGNKLLCPLTGAKDRYHTSMAPALLALPEYMQEAYFTRPWCLFTSDGCYYQCRFCAANKGVKERFRDPDTFTDEVKALMELTQRYAGDAPSYEIYLSSLDGCQNSQETERLLRVLQRVRAQSRMRLKLRCLATAKSVVRALSDDPCLLNRWHRYGVTCIGIGVDGVDPITWKRENKKHNTRDTIEQAFRLIRGAGIQEEALMVVGFPGDSTRSMLAFAHVSLLLAQRGTWVRPYLGKTLVPGTEGWRQNPDLVRELLSNPMLLRELDYAAVGNKYSHPDAQQRRIANVIYLVSILTLKRTQAGCATNPLLRTDSTSLPRRVLAGMWNKRQPIDR